LERICSKVEEKRGRRWRRKKKKDLNAPLIYTHIAP
jgi:hypothetical protein